MKFRLQYPRKQIHSFAVLLETGSRLRKKKRYPIRGVLLRSIWKPMLYEVLCERDRKTKKPKGFLKKTISSTMPLDHGTHCHYQAGCWYYPFLMSLRRERSKGRLRCHLPTCPQSAPSFRDLSLSSSQVERSVDAELKVLHGRKICKLGGTVNVIIGRRQRHVKLCLLKSLHACSWSRTTTGCRDHDFSSFSHEMLEIGAMEI